MLATVLVLVANALIVQGLSQPLPRCNDKPSPNTPPGAFIPTCAKTGWFNVTQCHASTGHCWCVRPDTGQEVAGSRVKGTAKCPKCLEARAAALRPANQPGGASSGYVPVCDDSGKYIPFQIDGSYYSFCVDVETGEKIPNTERPPGPPIKGDNCASRQAQASGTTTAPTSGPRPCTPPPPGATPAPPGTFTPKCTNEGQYERRQCSPSSGYCWCVDPNTGEKIPGTEKGPGGGEVSCDVARTSQPMARCNDKPSPNTPPGAFIPTCTKTGWFNVTQCHASTGQCWCVRPDGGQEVVGSRVKGNAKCPKCLEARAAALPPANQPGGGSSGYVPVCDDNGKYVPLQFSGSSGYSFCVDVETGEKIPNTERPPGPPIKGDNCASRQSQVTGTTTASTSGPRPCTPPHPRASHITPGTFTPKCTNEGQYERRQCSPSTGYCWCVDPNTGGKIPGTEKGPGRGEVSCDVTTTAPPTPTTTPPPPALEDNPCAKELKRLRGANSPRWAFFPTCTKTGWYNATQCHGSTGYCWCVVPESGKEVNGTRVPPGKGPTKCPRCLAANAEALPPPQPGGGGGYVPQCDQNGNYVPLQFAGSSGYSFCVDVETGEKIPNTEKPPGPPRNESECSGQSQGKGTTTAAPPPGPFDSTGPCTKESKRLQTANSPPGSFTPTCNENGWYNATQCHGSTGYCWCVFPEDGKELQGTRVPPSSTQRPACPKCLVHQAKQLPPMGAVGAYVPQCDQNGKYNPLQSHGSTGYSWCVDPDTGDEEPGSRKPPGQKREQPCFATRSKNVQSARSSGEAKGGVAVAAGVRNGLTVGSAPLQGPAKPAPAPGPGPAPQPAPKSAPAPGPAPQPQSGPAPRPASQSAPVSAPAPQSQPQPAPVSNSASTDGPCEIASRPAIGELPRPADWFTRACSKNGMFEALQCHPLSGCWCVDPRNGQEVNGTWTRPGRSRPTCGACHRNLSSSPRPAPGSYVAQCDQNGDYIALQVHPSSGNKWCVSPKTGQEVPNTRTGPGQQRSITCAGGMQTEGPCHSSLTGKFYKQCTKSGTFSPLQCDPVDGGCFCVDPATGEEIENTRKYSERGEREPQCGKCHIEYAERPPPMPGNTLPQCDDRGNYLPLQWSGSTGYRWCVDPATGAKVPGTEVPPAQSSKNLTCGGANNTKSEPVCKQEAPKFPGQPPWRDCTASGWYKPIQCRFLECFCANPHTGTVVEGTTVPQDKGHPQCGKCHMAYADAAQPTPGQYVPQCNKRGGYKAEQVHPFTGYRWCVTADGREVSGTRIGPGQARGKKCAAISDF